MVMGGAEDAESWGVERKGQACLGGRSNVDQFTGETCDSNMRLMMLHLLLGRLQDPLQLLLVF